MPATKTTARRANGRSTTRATTAPSCSTPTATTSRPSSTIVGRGRARSGAPQEPGEQARAAGLGLPPLVVVPHPPGRERRLDALGVRVPPARGVALRRD